MLRKYPPVIKNMGNPYKPNTMLKMPTTIEERILINTNCL